MATVSGSHRHMLAAGVSGTFRHIIDLLLFIGG
jgi:hypothetical protein